MLQSFKSLPLIIFSLFSFMANAQLFKEKRDSSKGYVYTYFEGDPTKSRTYILKNGLTVIMSVDIDKPRIYTCIAVKAGSNNDPKTNTGLAHYLEHMLFKGTDRFGTSDYKSEKNYLDQIEALYESYNKIKDEQKRKYIYKQIDSISAIAAKYSIANEYDKMLQNIGAKGTNAFTSFEETVYINDIPANQIDAWLEIEAERFRNPVLRLFHTELEAVYEEKNISLDNDYEKVIEVLYADLFKNHNYGTQTTIGKIEHLKNPSLSKIREYYLQNYVPNNMAIILSGYFDPEETLAKIEKNFNYMQPKEIVKPKFGSEKSKETIIPISVYGEESESVTIGYRLPGIQSAENYKSVLLKEILSNNVAGLIDININKKQLVLDAYAYLDQNKDNDILILEAYPKENQTLEEVKNLLLAQIDSIKFGKFDEKLIAAAGFNLKVENEKLFADNTNTAFSLLNSFTREIPFSKKLNEPNLIMNTKKIELSLYAKLQLKNNYSIVYKRQGKDTTLLKIIKPEIHPVALNRDKMSRFVKNILDNEVEDAKPVFVDFDKDILKDSISKNCQILYTPNKKNKLFTLSYVFEFGKYADQKLPIAFQLLKLSGTEKISSSDIAKEFYKLACSFDVIVANEQMYIQLSGPDSTFERAFSTMEYLIKNVKPEEKILNDLVNNILLERENSKFDKNAVSNALRNYMKFGKENPTTFQLSSKKLKKLKVNEMADLIHSIFGYNHKLLYFGPREFSNLKSQIVKNHFIPEIRKNTPENRVFKPMDYSASQVFFTNFDMVQAEVNWYSSGSNYELNNQPIIQLFNEYYGGGMTSIFFQTIRESKALAYSTFSEYKNPSSYNNIGSFSAYVGTQADKLDSAIISVNSLIQEIPISESLFENARKSIVSNVASDRILNDKILFYYLKLKRLNCNYDIRKDIYDKTNQLTILDMQNFHLQEIKQKKQAISIVGSKEKIDVKKLNKYGKVNVLTLKDIFNY